MIDIIGVRIDECGKVYYCDAKNISFNKGEYAIIEGPDGLDIAEVVIDNRSYDEEKSTIQIYKVIRKASAEDMNRNEKNKKNSKTAFDICKKKLKKYNLDIDLLQVKYTFDKEKLYIIYKAEGRVDYREIVKELATTFKTRIEFKQITEREEPAKYGGYGVCGRELCCCTFETGDSPLTIKMAKEQNLSLNSSKISGMCGRIKCCLKFEHEVYEDKLERLPLTGAIVKTDEGEGIVDDIAIYKEIIRVKFKDEEDNDYYKNYKLEEIEVLQDLKKEKQKEKEEKQVDKKENNKNNNNKKENVEKDKENTYNGNNENKKVEDKELKNTKDKEEIKIKNKNKIKNKSRGKNTHKKKGGK